MFFLTWSFFGSTLLGCLGHLLSFQQTSLQTALCLFVPQGLALTCLTLTNTRDLLRFRLVPGLFVLAMVSAFWLVNFLFERSTVQTLGPVELWDFDSKRPWFFLHGFWLAGLLGMLAALTPTRFFKVFPLLFASTSLLTSMVYLLNYNRQHEAARLLDTLGLGAGLHASWGAGATLYLLLNLGGQPVRRRHRGWLVAAALVALLLQTAAVVLSGTRAALLTWGLDVLLFLVLAWRQGSRGRCLLVGGALAMLLTGGYPLVPEATLERFGAFRETGYEPRMKLQKAAVEEIAQHPLGMVFGFNESALGMEYCHNALLQLIAEAGLQSLPALGLLLVLAGRRIYQHWSGPATAFLLLTAGDILVQSFSAGSAYHPGLWFFIFFVAALPGATRRRSPSRLAMPLSAEIRTRPAAG